MGFRKVEKFQFRAVLVGLRQGNSGRDIARAWQKGRARVANFRGLTARQRWLDADAGVPEDAATRPLAATVRLSLALGKVA